MVLGRLPHPQFQDDARFDISAVWRYAASFAKVGRDMQVGLLSVRHLDYLAALIFQMSRDRLGAIIGVASGLGCVVLSTWLIVAPPYRPLSFHDAGVWAGIIPVLGLLGIFAVLAAWHRRRRVLLGLFFASFVPFGFYLFLTFPGIFGWLGASHLGYLVAGFLIRVQAPRDA
jgi:hypothetical protein